MADTKEASKSTTKLKGGFLALFGLVGLYLAYSVLFQVSAAGSQSSTYQVQVSNDRANISDIVCCFNVSGGSFNPSSCKTGGGSYTISEASNYDMVCNFTVTDPNGYQDMGDGWANITWYRDSVAWNAPLGFDNMYANSSCRNISGTSSGNTIRYECSISGIKYWADAGNWTLLVNLTDGTDAGYPGVSYITITNVTTLWQSPTISFGSMSLGTNGSQSHLGYASINATTNNTGNTRIGIEVQAGQQYMNCSIGAIDANTYYLKYDKAYNLQMETACGALTTTSAWSGGCGANINLQDCSTTCATLPLSNTYWGITIPPSGVGGICTLSITVTAVQV